MTFKFSFYFLFITCLFFSCQKLEKEGLPLAVGIRLSEPIEIEKVRKDLVKIQALGCKDISLEILVQTIGDSAWPHIPETTIHSLLALQSLKEFKNFNIHLIFGHADIPYLFPHGAPLKVEKWFQEYRKTVDSTIALCQFKPLRIIPAIDLIYEKEFVQYWKEWVEMLKAKYQVPISYSCNFTTLHESFLMQYSDEIGVFYEISSDEEPKKHARNWHKNISSYANKFQKPIILTHANIYGHENALVEFQNRLRFWTAPVHLVSLNSIFSESIFTHQGNYFDVTKDVEFQEYIKNYYLTSKK